RDQHPAAAHRNPLQRVPVRRRVRRRLAARAAGARHPRSQVLRGKQKMSIKIESVSKKFGDFTALDNVNLEIASGELVALLSPSGMGKTTLLRIIAGLEWPDAGQVLFHGEDATDTHARDRNVGFVFQHYALFRHMTIFENVAFGLRVRPKHERPSEDKIREKVMSLLKLVQLDWLADRYPHQLSGGQRPRLALPRPPPLPP